MGVVQINHHRGDGVAEGRAPLPSRRGVSAHLLATAGATTAEQAHLGHMRLDRWQLDAFIDLLRGLRGPPERLHYTSGRQATWHRTADRGSDAAPDQSRAYSCA